MFLKRISLIVLSGCAFMTSVKAQSDAQFTQYWISKSYYNPAAIGLSNDLNLSTLFRQHTECVGSKQRAYGFKADMPAFLLGTPHGVGVSVFHENITFNKNLRVDLQYAYAVRLAAGNLRLGIQPSVIRTQFDGTKVQLPAGENQNYEDPDISVIKERALNFGLSLGAYYQNKNLYLGLSWQNLFQAAIRSGVNDNTQISGTLYLMGGYTCYFPYSLLQVEPSFLLKTDLNHYQFNLNLLFTYDNRLFGGLGYHLNETVSLCAGFDFGRVRLGYSYGFALSEIFQIRKGSHELFVNYLFPLNFKSGKLNQVRKRSVRFL
ncbi:MAG: PorP/SprF family type IX secretion system membrane protein [Bacteroidales bacterium]